MSGASNVNYWLEQHGVKPNDQLVAEILQAAKERDRVLTDEEVLDICRVKAG